MVVIFMSVAFIIVRYYCSFIHHIFCISSTSHPTGTPESLKDLASKNRLGKALPLMQKGRRGVVRVAIFCFTPTFRALHSDFHDQFFYTNCDVENIHVKRSPIWNSVIQKTREG